MTFWLHEFKNWDILNSAHAILINQCLIEQATPKDHAGIFPWSLVYVGDELHDFEIPKIDFLTSRI